MFVLQVPQASQGAPRAFAAALASFRALSGGDPVVAAGAAPQARQACGGGSSFVVRWPIDSWCECWQVAKEHRWPMGQRDAH